MLGKVLKENSALTFLVKFFIRAFIFFIAWMLVYEGYIAHSRFVDQILVNHLVNFSSGLLSVLGFHVFTDGAVVGIDGTHGVTVGIPCNGMRLFGLFVGFIVSFQGKWSYKFLFIISGLLLIHILNIVRIVGLAIVVNINPESLEFNHKYTFTLIVYTFVFLLWVIWVKFLAQKK